MRQKMTYAQARAWLFEHREDIAVRAYVDGAWGSFRLSNLPQPLLESWSQRLAQRLVRGAAVEKMDGKL